VSRTEIDVFTKSDRIVLPTCAGPPLAIMPLHRQCIAAGCSLASGKTTVKQRSIDGQTTEKLLMHSPISNVLALTFIAGLPRTS
jgi:hypothetical protein